MSDVMVFENHFFGSVRAVEINGEPWFVAKDVCDCLDFSDVSTMLNGLDNDDKSINIICTPDGAQEMPTVSYIGLCDLVQRSCSPNARAFRFWVTQVVVPAVRKSGMRAPHTYLEALKQRVAFEEARLAEEEEKRKAQIAFEQEKLVDPRELIAGVL